jgi:hypothetical protein
MLSCLDMLSSSRQHSESTREGSVVNGVYALFMEQYPVVIPQSSATCSFATQALAVATYLHYSTVIAAPQSSNYCAVNSSIPDKTTHFTVLHWCCICATTQSLYCCKTMLPASSGC